MKKNVLTFLALSALVFTGCNAIGDKDTIVGRVNGESIYQEDIDLMQRLSGEKVTSQNMVSSIASLFSRNAIYSAALDEHPEYKDELKNRSLIYADYLLTFAFQRFYAMDRLMFSDSELRAYFDSHRDQFPDSSSYMEIRNVVAEKLFLERNADSLASFINSHQAADASENNSEKLQQEFVRNYRSALANSMGDSLALVYNLKVEPIVPATPEEYYEKHKDRFVTEPGLEVYHVEMADSSALAAMFFSDTMNLDEFKKIARENSLNKVTASNDGYVGKVLEKHVLPYGIGNMVSLFETMKGKPVGSVSAPIRSFEGSTFHVFYLAAEVPSRQKSFEQARLAIKNELEHSINYELDSSYVLVTMNGEPVYRESDVLEVFASNFGMRRNRSSHDKVVRSLLYNHAFALEAKKRKIDHSWEYRALERQSRLEFVNNAFNGHYMNLVNHSDDTLKALYDSLGGDPAHPSFDFERSKRDLSDWLDMSEFVYKLRYYGYQGNYLPKTFEEAKADVFSESIVNYRNARWDSVTVAAWNKAKISLYDQSIKLLHQESTIEASMARLDSLYKERKYNDALEGWESLRNRNSQNEAIVKKATYEMARIGSENGMYDESVRQYRSFYKIWPDDPDAEKAMFSCGFIYTENLHKDSLALEVFEEFKAKYPKSELNESVDWLIANIKSGGKLAEDLMKKISEEP